jgi:hypothetical protein
MSDEANIPSWVRGAARVDRPKIDAWYRPEDGALEGTLIWRGQQESPTSGDVFNAYAIRKPDGNKVIGVSERAGLRNLRSVRIGSRIFIRPTGVMVLDSGRKMQQFEIFADHLEPLSEPVRGGGSRGGATSSDDGSGTSEKVPF